jgi:hypothetical protein
MVSVDVLVDVLGGMLLVSAAVDEDVVGAVVSAVDPPDAQAPNRARPGVSKARRRVVFLVIGVSRLRRALSRMGKASNGTHSVIPLIGQGHSAAVKRW